tara:strand:- start:3852 stop:5072 length:1221 start_codon:yes stop_codon:yes gene_type:complete
LNNLSVNLIPIAGFINKATRILAVFYLLSVSEPESFSIWATIALILQYSFYLQLGVPFSMTREISIAVGEDNQSKKDLIVSTSTINLIFASIILYFLLGFFGPSYLFIYIFLYLTISHASALFINQSRSKFNNYAVIAAFLIESLIIVFGIFFYFNQNEPLLSFIFVLSLAAFFNCIICFPYKEISNIFKSSIGEIYRVEKQLLGFGLPLLLFSVILLFCTTWDLIVIQYISPSLYVSYSSVFFFGNSVKIFGALVGMMFLPIMAREFGRSGTISSVILMQKFREYRAYIFYSFLLFLLFFYPALTFLTKTILNEYQHLNNIIMFRTTAIFLGLLAIPYLHLFNTLRKTRLSIFIILTSTLFALFLATLCLSFLPFDVSFVIAHLFSSLLMLALCIFHLNKLNEKS